MVKIIKLPIKSAGRFGFKTVRKRKHQKLEDRGQLNLFQNKPDAKIVSFHSREDEDIFERASGLHDSNPDMAFALYQKSIENNEHVADSYCNVGILQSEKGDVAVAINSFTRALENEPRHFESQFNLANIYADAGNHQLAELHYKISSEIEPRDLNVSYNLALVQAMQEKYHESLISLNNYFDHKSDLIEDKEAEKLLTLLQNTVRSAQ